MSRARRQRVERTLIRIYLATRGRGKQWRAAKRTVARFISSEQARRVIRVAALLTVARPILRDLLDGYLDGVVNLVRIIA